MSRNVKSNIEVNHETKTENNFRPITNLPTTIGKALDLRNRVEKRITNIHDSHIDKNPFWSVWSMGSSDVASSATEIVQSVLDRHKVLFELNEIISAVSALKDSGVVVPQFLPGTSSYNLTLGQLRDAEVWLLPHLEALHDSVTSQMNSIVVACNEHDERVEQELKNELAQLEKTFKEKSETAERYKEKSPSEDDLKVDKTTAVRRAETKRSVRIDRVGVKDLLLTLRPFITLLKEKRNDKIDACNSQDINSELNKLSKLIGSAHNMIRFGSKDNEERSEEKKESETGLENEENIISAAELKSRVTVLDNLISVAARFVTVVSYRKGSNGKIESPIVEFGLQRLVEVFNNIQKLMTYRAAHRSIMSLMFTAIHPLSNTPCSLDAMVRLGYSVRNKTDELSKSHNHKHAVAPKNMRGRGRGRGRGGGRGRGRGRERDRGTRHSRETKTAYLSALEEQELDFEDESQKELESSDLDKRVSLFNSLFQLEKHLNCAKSQMDNEKEEHEAKIRSSISEKQEARSKSGAQIKGTELEELAKAVRASDAKEFSISSDLDEAKKCICSLLESVQSLQSAERKSANATLTISVPEFSRMDWINDSTEFRGW